MKSKLIGVAVVLLACGQAETGSVGSSHEELNGDTWTTVVNSSGDGYGAVYNGLSWNNTTVYVVGTRNEPSNEKWIFRHSTDGTTFTNDDAYEYPGSLLNEAYGAAYAWDTGYLFAAGLTRLASGSSYVDHLLVRYAPNITSSFINVVDIVQPVGTRVSAVHIRWNNGLYVSYKTTTGSTTTSNLLYSANGTSGWTPLAAPPSTLVYDICGVSLGVLAVGSSGTNWVTYLTQDHATWKLLDTYTAIGGSAAAHACGFNGSDIYSVGTLWQNGTPYWTVRKGDGITGNNWSTVNLQAMQSTDYGPLAITSGNSGKPYVAGHFKSGANPWFWRVRRGSTTGTTWVDSDEYQPTSGNTYVYDITGTPSLGTFAVGLMNDNAIIRRLAP